MKAAPPEGAEKGKRKLMKEPPKNLYKPGQERLPCEVSIITEAIRSDGSEARGEMRAGPIDIDKYEYATGAKIRMEMPLLKEQTPSRETCA